MTPSGTGMLPSQKVGVNSLVSEYSSLSLSESLPLRFAYLLSSSNKFTSLSGAVDCLDFTLEDIFVLDADAGGPLFWDVGLDAETLGFLAGLGTLDLDDWSLGLLAAGGAEAGGGTFVGIVGTDKAKFKIQIKRNSHFWCNFLVVLKN